MQNQRRFERIAGVVLSFCLFAASLVGCNMPLLDTGAAGGTLNYSWMSIDSELPASAAPGEPVTVNVSVQGAAPEDPAASGTVSILITDLDQESSACTLTLLDGKGSCQVLFEKSGFQFIRAVYSGDAYFRTTAAIDDYFVTAPEPLSAEDAELNALYERIRNTDLSIDTSNPDPSAPGEMVEFTVYLSGMIPTDGYSVRLIGEQGDGPDCRITFDPHGIGTCKSPLGSLGRHRIWAFYFYNQTYTGVSAVGWQDVSHPTGISLSISPELPAVGQPFTATVNISPGEPGGPQPTGTVRFIWDANGEVCEKSLTNGSASCEHVYTQAGTYKPRVEYRNTVYFRPGDTTLQIELQPDPTSGIVPADPPGGGNTGGGGTPGTATGSDPSGGNTNGTGSDPTGGNANSTGSGSTFSSDGGHVVWMTFQSRLPENAGPGEPVTVTVWVDGYYPQDPAVTGTVELYITDLDNDTYACTLTLADEIGSCQVVFAQSGSQFIRAVYSGDAFYRATTALVDYFVKDVEDAAAEDTLFVGDYERARNSNLSISTHSPNPSTPGQIVEFKIQLTGTQPEEGSYVRLVGEQGQGPDCRITLDTTGIGSCQVSVNSAGHHRIWAYYYYDQTYTGVSTLVFQDVNYPTGMTLSISPNPPIAGQPVIVTAYISDGDNGGPEVAGSVQFGWNGAANDCEASLTNGSASCEHVYEEAGAYTLHAKYIRAVYDYRVSNISLPIHVQPDTGILPAPTLRQAPIATERPANVPYVPATDEPIGGEGEGGGGGGGCWVPDGAYTQLVCYIPCPYPEDLASGYLSACP